MVQTGRFMGYTETGQSRANEGIPRSACNPDLNHVEDALIDYGQRSRAGKPISTSRAEGTVNRLVSARMNKCRQMRWSPRGARRVLQVRAARLNGRFGHQAIHFAA